MKYIVPNVRGWRGAPSVLEDFDRWFETFLAPVDTKEGGFVPSVDIEENEKGYSLSFDLPGVKREDVKVEVKDNYLSVSGERRQTKSTESGEFRRVEKTYGEFKRMFSLPQGVDSTKVAASFNDGVLKVELPKSPTAQPVTIKIN